MRKSRLGSKQMVTSEKNGQKSPTTERLGKHDSKDKDNEEDPVREIAPETQGWSDRQTEQDAEDKELIADDFVAHEFLVPENGNPEKSPRLKVASIAVSNGTSQSEGVSAVLRWVEQRAVKHESFDLNWYATGSVVPTILRDFVQKHPDLMAACQLFLFPGKVDRNLGSVSGPEAVAFVKTFKRRFTYAFLGAHAFDLVTGDAYFHFSEELELQQACASLLAAQKYLFLSPRKFKADELEGHVGYGLLDVLAGASSVTICTASSTNDEWIKKTFDALCLRVLSADPARGEPRRLSLRLVGRNGAKPVVIHKNGFIERKG